MSRAAINANVTTRCERDIGGILRKSIKAVMPMYEFCAKYNLTNNAVIDRLNDPDKFTLGQLRELRVILGMTKEEFVDLVRWAI